MLPQMLVAIVLLGSAAFAQSAGAAATIEKSKPDGQHGHYRGLEYVR